MAQQIKTKMSVLYFIDAPDGELRFKNLRIHECNTAGFHMNQVTGVSLIIQVIFVDVTFPNHTWNFLHKKGAKIFLL